METTAKTNFFFDYLCLLFGRVDAKAVFDRYHLAIDATIGNHTLFGYIDEKQHWVRAKSKNLQQVDRILYSTAIEWTFDAESTRPIMYGAHQVDPFNSKPKELMIVPTEEAAVIMSIFNPGKTWLAWPEDKAYFPLLWSYKRHKLVIFPRKGEYQDMAARLSRYNGDGYCIELSDALVNQPELYDGMTIADLMIMDQLKERNQWISQRARSRPDARATVSLRQSCGRVMLDLFERDKRIRRAMRHTKSK